MGTPKVRILVLSYYFYPDLSAGSFRITALVESLARLLSEDDDLHVLTTEPNRYASFSVNAEEKDFGPRVSVSRVPLPQHRSGMLDQSRGFLRFARSVRQLTTNNRYDIVFASSSRLMTAALAAHIARRVGARLYLDIRDILPDTLKDVFGSSPMRGVLPLLRGLEARTIRRADRVNLVSAGFVPYFESLRPDLTYRVYTNGIDQEFLGKSFDTEPLEGLPVILYAGNIGEGQGLEHIIPGAAKALESRFRFEVIGDGGRRPRLEAAIKDKGVTNVTLIDPMSRGELMERYGKASVLFLHLNDYEAFHKVLPSKIFEYAATGKPMLAGVSGYAREFIENNIVNAATFDPCNVDGLLQSLTTLDLKTELREEFNARYSRGSIIGAMSRDVLNLMDDVANL